jgi:AGZA family xanthine/uracil permease-like MFS transporter
VSTHLYTQYVLVIYFTANAILRRSTSFTYFPHDKDGDIRFDFFRKVVAFRPFPHLLNNLQWDISSGGKQFGLALFTFLYVDIIDCTATLYGMARFAGVVDPETADFPRSTWAYCCDAFSISIGALFGLSPVTVFVESGAGVTEGGKTGLTGVICGMCFLLSLFISPIFASVPSYATGCTLVLVRISTVELNEFLLIYLVGRLHDDASGRVDQLEIPW